MAMKELILDIDPSGQTQGMHFDEFPLGYLGPMEVTRASEIFHNPETQQWDVVLPGHKCAVPEASGFAGYDPARSFEVEWLQKCRQKGVQPDSITGRGLALLVRVEAEGKAPA